MHITKYSKKAYLKQELTKKAERVHIYEVFYRDYHIVLIPYCDEDFAKQ